MILNTNVNRKIYSYYIMTKEQIIRNIQSVDKKYIYCYKTKQCAKYVCGIKNICESICTHVDMYSINKIIWLDDTIYVEHEQ